MGSKSLKGWLEAVGFTIVALIFTYLPNVAGFDLGALAVLPLVFIGLRRGLLQGLFASVLTGVIALVLHGAGDDLSATIVAHFGPYAFVGFSAFFAKFTQRTLYNKRFSNAALNIVTASLFGNVFYYLWLFVGDDAVVLGDLAVSFLINVLIVVFVLLLIAKLFPAAFIPKDTPFLSRKEKSKLLND